MLSLLIAAAMFVSAVAANTVSAGAAVNGEQTQALSISFDVASAGWTNVSSVYCHIWRADGMGTNTGGSWLEWQSKQEKCEYNADTGIAAFNLTNTGNSFSYEDGKDYCVVFSSDRGAETYPAVMSGRCIGDTLYAADDIIQSPDDSDRKITTVEWRNNPDCGALKQIDFNGNIQGRVHPENENDATMLARYLIKYYDNTYVTAHVPGLLETLNLSKEDTMSAVYYVLDADNPDYDTIVKAVENTLNANLPSSDEPVQNPLIYFDAASAGWQNFQTIYCHVFCLDENYKTTAGAGWNQVGWQHKDEKCEYNAETGIAAYDLSKTGNEFRTSDGKIYCLIFSSNTGIQIFNTIMNGSCIGDTLYCTGDYIETASGNRIPEALWRINSDCGPRKEITSGGRILGDTLAEGMTDERLLADYLLTYYSLNSDIYTGIDVVQSLINKLCVSPTDVMFEVYDMAQTEEALDAVLGILEQCREPIRQIYGDVNGDGEISIMDATLIQKHCARIELIEGTAFILADFNGDNQLTVREATQIQQYIAKLISSEIIGTEYVLA